MKAALDMLFEYDATLRDGFWPIPRVSTLFKDEFIETSDVLEEFDENEHFRPAESFRVN